MNVSGEEFAMLDEVVSSIYNRGIKDGMEVSENMYQQGLNDAWECARKINDMYYQKLNEVFPDSTHDNIFIDYSAQEAMQKIKEYEERQKDDEKSCGTCKHVMRIDCGAYPCNECPRDTLPKWEPKQTDEIKEYEEQQKRDERKVDCEVTACYNCVNHGACDYEYEKKQTDAPVINVGSIKVGDEVRIKGSDLVKNDCDYGVCTRSLPNINTIYVMRRDGSSGEENKDEWYRTGRYFPQIAEVLKLL